MPMMDLIKGGGISNKEETTFCMRNAGFDRYQALTHLVSCQSQVIFRVVAEIANPDFYISLIFGLFMLVFSVQELFFFPNKPNQFNIYLRH